MFLEPISAIQPALRAWRRTRATRSVGTWAWPDCSMAVRGIGGCANTFLPLSSGTYDKIKKHSPRQVMADWGPKYAFEVQT